MTENQGFKVKIARKYNARRAIINVWHGRGFDPKDGFPARFVLSGALLPNDELTGENAVVVQVNGVEVDAWYQIVCLDFHAGVLKSQFIIAHGLTQHIVHHNLSLYRLSMELIINERLVLHWVGVHIMNGDFPGLENKRPVWLLLHQQS